MVFSSQPANYRVMPLAWHFHNLTRGDFFSSLLHAPSAATDLGRDSPGMTLIQIAKKHSDASAFKHATDKKYF